MTPTELQRQNARDLEQPVDLSKVPGSFVHALMQARDRHHARLAGKLAFDTAVRPAVLQ